MRQIKAVSVILEDMVLGTVLEKTEGGNTKILVLDLQGSRNWIYPIKQQFLAVYTVLQVEPLTKEQLTHPYQGMY